MDETMRRLSAELRTMPSTVAADWLLQHYPSGGKAIILLEHVSLKKSDERRLASLYLAGPSHAHNRAYCHFVQRLGLRELVRVLDETHVRDNHDAVLLAYHRKPLLAQAKDAQELREATAFLDKLAQA